MSFLDVFQILKSEQEQKAVTNLFLRIFETRQSLIQEGLPGTETLDPTLHIVVMNKWRFY